MTLEFGRPTTPDQALIRIPDRTHPDYENPDSPYHGVAHIREFIADFLKIHGDGKPGGFDLSDRMASATTEEIRLLFQVNSFYRNLKDAFTEQWSAINLESSWADYFPSGDDEYRWWQITTLDPDIAVSGYRLYCVEFNGEFSVIKSNTRFNEHSEFELMFATEVEIDSLKEALKRSLR